MLSSGTRIEDRYEIIGALGSGGMGQVYRARRIHLGDDVALKVMQAAAGAPPETRERFLRESRACAQLHHPNIVGLLDFGFDGSDQPYMVMELLTGPSLREEIDLDAPMSPSRVVTILDGVASALQLAHDRGITHRDLKPANIVAHRYESGDRVYKVIDFGLVALQAASDQARLTAPAMFLGTLAYAAPEQVRGDEITPRADVYALGVIAYEMLTGGCPFAASNPATLISKKLTESPAAITTIGSGLSPSIEDAVLKALRVEPGERWGSVKDFIAALRAAVGQTVEPAARAIENGLLSRYELGALVGRGRLGSLVYSGTHRALGVPVAIRILKRENQPHWDAVRARFLLEARTLQVSHPGLLQVRDFGEDDRSVYLVTDLIQGPSLREAMAEAGPMAWPRAASLITQALDAVSALHARGGFICGANPDMIRLRANPGDERIVISSAGIDSVQDVLATMREQELRGEEASQNELPYVAPEVMMGSAPDARADIFTIGVIAYQMVAGALPYKAPSLPELIGQMLQVKPAALSDHIPSAARHAIARAIDGAASNRFESARQFADALRWPNA